MKSASLQILFLASVICLQRACSLQCRPCCSSMIYWSGVTVFITSLIFCTAPNYPLLMIYSPQRHPAQDDLTVSRILLISQLSHFYSYGGCHQPLMWPGVMRDKSGDKWHISSVTWQHDISSHLLITLTTACKLVIFTSPGKERAEWSGGNKV